MSYLKILYTHMSYREKNKQYISAVKKKRSLTVFVHLELKGFKSTLQDIIFLNKNNVTLIRTKILN